MSDNQAQGDQPREAPQGIAGAVNFVIASKVDGLLWVTRLTTVVLTICFLLGLLNPAVTYQRVLLANAATSALRLHQRMPRQSFSREFIALLLIEDACHYLFYSLIFMFNQPVTMALLPVFLFALLHSTKYTRQVFGVMGIQSGFLINGITLIESHQQKMLQMIALTEIFLMPMAIAALFTYLYDIGRWMSIFINNNPLQLVRYNYPLSGHGTLMTPFIYYRFLSLRYASRRNPYTRNMFRELRLSADQMMMNPACPNIVRRFGNSAISFICQLAPQVPQ